jgi:hypothetical protein
MPMNRIQLQPGLSLTRFLELYGTEEQCEAAPNGCGAQKFVFSLARCS